MSAEPARPGAPDSPASDAAAEPAPAEPPSRQPTDTSAASATPGGTPPVASPGLSGQPTPGTTGTWGRTTGTTTTTGAHPPAVAPPRVHAPANPTGNRLALLTLTALGVVFGDIGTSPLYAFKECFSGSHGVAPTRDNVYGVLSLIVWSLTIVVTVKYVGFVMRADNKGEGGILSLLALILQRQHRARDAMVRTVLVACGLFGAALLYGDGVITPAITTLSAMEGLVVISPTFENAVVVLTVLIIAAVFWGQRFGTERVGRVFGPVMFVWFTTLAVLGLLEMRHHPGILAAVWPAYAVRFMAEHGFVAFVILGSVVLAVTGAEALYADMGHFGRKPIRLAWLGFVFPCLLLNYFGQGALLLRDPTAAENPFYMLAPTSLTFPLLVLATFAAIIASQAMISGAFSITQQGVQLGYMPRVNIVHTSEKEAGQIYIPEVNFALAAGCILIVLAFRTSTALAAAYGIAVTGTFVMTTVLFYFLARSRWGWSRLRAGALTGLFLVVDLSFFGANVLKITHGGWVPMLIGVVLFVLMTTWKRGRELLYAILARGTLPIDDFLADVARRKPPRVPGTAVFMTSTSGGAPVVLLHHLKHNKVLHERVILLSVRSAEVPDVDEEELLEVEDLGHGFHRVVVTYGFMETPDIPNVMRFLAARGLRARPQEISYFLGRERLIPTGAAPMSRWRKKLFVIMSRNARSATEFFNIPPNRVVELGTQIEF